MAPKDFSILVVEDDPNDLFFILDTLTKAAPRGSTFHAVHNGAEAISYLMGEGEFADRTKHPYPTIIITDLKMPVADGFKVLNHRHNNPAWGTIPTIVLSASKDPDDIRNAYFLGASAYHRKPQDLEGLRQLFERFFRYWEVAEVPAIEASGRQVVTLSEGKLGERYPQPKNPRQKRARE